jgi:hypothetical protein
VEDRSQRDDLSVASFGSGQAQRHAVYPQRVMKIMTAGFMFELLFRKE